MPGASVSWFYCAHLSALWAIALGVAGLSIWPWLIVSAGQALIGGVLADRARNAHLRSDA